VLFNTTRRARARAQNNAHGKWPSVFLATTRALLIAMREDALDASFPAVMLAPASAICSTSR
jgi:hypothetical protein